MSPAGEIGRCPAAAEREALRTGPPPAGLCASCLHLRLLSSKTSTFVRCARAETDPGFPRYPPLPVRACRGWEEYRSVDAGSLPSAGES